MVATIEEPMGKTEFSLKDPVALMTPAAESPAMVIAHAYLHAVCVDWQDGSEFQRICELLASSRDEALPPRPLGAPDSVSPHAAGGHGVSWYMLGTNVVGYIAESQSGYRVPAAAVRALPKMV